MLLEIVVTRYSEEKTAQTPKQLLALTIPIRTSLKVKDAKANNTLIHFLNTQPLSALDLQSTVGEIKEKELQGVIEELVSQAGRKAISNKVDAERLEIHIIDCYEPLELASFSEASLKTYLLEMVNQYPATPSGIYRSAYVTQSEMSHTKAKTLAATLARDGVSAAAAAKGRYGLHYALIKAEGLESELFKAQHQKTEQPSCCCSIM